MSDERTTCGKPKCDGEVTTYCNGMLFSCSICDAPGKSGLAHIFRCHKLHGHADEAKPKPVDLSDLIKRVENEPEYTSRAGYSTWQPYVTINATRLERDEIVTALRVLRVLRHPRCDEGYFTGTGKLVFRLDGTPARRLLDDAYRILFGDGGER